MEIVPPKTVEVGEGGIVVPVSSLLVLKRRWAMGIGLIGCSAMAGWLDEKGGLSSADLDAAEGMSSPPRTVDDLLLGLFFAPMAKRARSRRPYAARVASFFTRRYRKRKTRRRRMITTATEHSYG